MNLDLKDKVVLVTGGTGGIGGQVVADYLDEGAIVACLIRNDKKMEILHYHHLIFMMKVVFYLIIIIQNIYC